MGNIFNFFNQGWVGSFIGLIGIIIAIITYKKSKIGARLSLQWDSNKIIDKNPKGPQEIGITYNGMNVERVVKTNIVLWNSGNGTVYGSNVVSEDPIRFEFDKEETIIGLQILKRSKEVNNFLIEIDSERQNVAKCSFSFLDPNDGVVIELLHTDINRYPVVNGTIVGLPEGILNWSIAREKAKNRISSILLNNKVTNFALPLAVVSGVFSLILGFAKLFNTDGNSTKLWDNNDSYVFSTLTLFLFGVLYTVFPTYFYIVTRRKFPKTLMYEK